MTTNKFIKPFLMLSVSAAFLSATSLALADIEAGKKTYDSTCFACHNTGVAGSPKLGDKEAWAPRIAEGMETVYKIALEGKGAMPPKGGRADLSDEAVKDAVDYMVSKAK